VIRFEEAFPKIKKKGKSKKSEMPDGIGNDVADENFAMGCVRQPVGLPSELYPHGKSYYTSYFLICKEIIGKIN